MLGNKEKPYCAIIDMYVCIQQEIWWHEAGSGRGKAILVLHSRICDFSVEGQRRGEERGRPGDKGQIGT